MSDDLSSQELPAGLELGEYTILRTLGQGGFGITYLARDNTLETEVVIKENLPFMFAHRDATSLQVSAIQGAAENGSFEWAVENFLNEARTLAKLRHPNIVKILRAFNALGTAYFVMPYIEGASLDKWYEQHGAPAEEWLRVFLASMLNALSYLHGKGLLHRDIKPANILMTEEGIPILIDFGTARQLISDKSQTVIESAGYTPFEQMQSRGNVGPWSDIYALGCTMYKLMTGETPPRCADRIGQEAEHQRLATRPELRCRYSPEWLSAIDKAMAVWPQERWQGAAEWAAALEGDNLEPSAVPRKVKAGAVAKSSLSGESSQRFGRLPQLVVLLLLVLAALAAVVAERTRRKEPPSVVQERREEPLPPQPKSPCLARIPEGRGIIFSPDGQHFVVRHPDNVISLWNASACSRIGEPVTLGDKELHGWRIAFSPDSRFVAAWRTMGVSEVKLWEVDTGRLIGTADKSGWLDVAFSPDSRFMAVFNEPNRLRLYTTNTCVPYGGALLHDARVSEMAFSPNGDYLATASLDKTLNLWRTDSTQRAGKPLMLGENITTLAFAARGERLVTCSEDGRANLYQVTNKGPQFLCALGFQAKKVESSSDGNCIAMQMEDHSVQLLRADTGRLVGTPLRHREEVDDLLFSPDGSRVVTHHGINEEGYGAAFLWDAHTGEAVGEPLCHESDILWSAFSPDGKVLVTASMDETARIWDARTGEALSGPLKHMGPATQICFSRDGSCFSTHSAFRYDAAHLWSTRTGKPVGEYMNSEGEARSITLNPDGSTFATTHADGTLRIWAMPQE